MPRLPWLFGTLFLLAAWTGRAPAGVIDLRSLPGNYDQIEFGHLGASHYYAQSFIADGNLLTETAVLVRSTNGQNLPFTIAITGDRPDAGGLGFAPDLLDVRAGTPPNVAPAGDGSQPYTEFRGYLNWNLPVTPGERLFLVLGVSGIEGKGYGSVLSTQPGASKDPYPQGEFVYFDGSGSPEAVNAAPWQHRAFANQDLAVYVKFVNDVPEPGGLTLLAAGLASLGGYAWKRVGKVSRRAVAGERPLSSRSARGSWAA